MADKLTAILQRAIDRAYNSKIMEMMGYGLIFNYEV